MSAPSAASPVASAEAVARTRPAALAAGPLRRIADGTVAMSLTEWRKLRHNQLDLLTRSVQPLLWLFVFGTAMSRLHSIPTGGIEYRAYLAPGIMAQAAMFVAIFFGLAVIWERDVGQLQRLLATPLPRSAIVLGKARARPRARSSRPCCCCGGRDRRHRAALDVSACRRAGPAGDRHRRVRLPVDDDRLARQGARALHGHRPARDDAAVLRLLGAVPAGDHARVAESGRAREPAHLRGRRSARIPARRRPSAAGPAGVPGLAGRVRDRWRPARIPRALL